MTSDISGDERDVHDVARQIADYLEQHPRSADTLEGVVNWWLRLQRYTEASRVVEQALQLLIEEQKVRKQVMADGTAVYSKTNGIQRGSNGDG